MLALPDKDLNTLAVALLAIGIPALPFMFILWCLLWDEVLWPRITCHKIVEVEHLNDELVVEVEEIVKYNKFINRESNIKRPTVEDINNEKPRVFLRTRVSGSEELRESTFEFNKRRGHWWAREGWDGDPANLDTTRRAVVHIVPSDKDYSYTTTEIWHYRLCNKKTLKKEGKDHEHTGMCELVNSIKHVTWHIKTKKEAS